MIKKLLFLLLIMSCYSCTLHPPYERPYIDTPDAWRLQSNEFNTLANLDWWEQFHDPVLTALIEEALENNRDLKFAIARVYQFWAQYQIVRSALYPQVYGNAAASRQQTSLDVTPLFPGQKRLTNEFTLLGMVNYELDIWGQIRSATEVSLAQLLSSIEARRTVVLTLVSDVAAAYVQLRLYDKQIEIAELTLDSRVQSFNLAKLRFEEGQIAELDVAQAESEVESATISLKEFLLSQQLQENLLCILLGRNPGPIVRGLGVYELAEPCIIPEGLPSDLLNQRPDIKEAEDLLIAANANIGVATAALFPQITLTGFFGNESLQLKDLFTSPAATWQYAANLSQLIFDAGKTVAGIDLAYAQKLQALYHYQQTILVAFREVDDALVQHKIYWDLLKDHHKQVKVLELYFHLATLRYENGQTDYLNVLDAERNLFRAQLDDAQAQGDLFFSIISMYKALAGGWVIEADDSIDKCLIDDLN